MKGITYEVVSTLGELGTSAKNGWTRKVRLVSWNGRPAKLDIREWSPDDKRMGKGVTLTDDEARILLDSLKIINNQ